MAESQILLLWAFKFINVYWHKLIVWFYILCKGAGWIKTNTSSREYNPMLLTQCKETSNQTFLQDPFSLYKNWMLLCASYHPHIYLWATLTATTHCGEGTLDAKGRRIRHIVCIEWQFIHIYASHLWNILWPSTSALLNQSWWWTFRGGYGTTSVRVTTFQLFLIVRGLLP